MVFSAHIVMWVNAPPPETSSPFAAAFASPQRTRLRSLRWVLGVTYASSPTIGLTPVPLDALWNSYAPNRLPWSVTAMAGMPCSSHPAKRSLMRAAPSSMEYSECTCRCTKLSLEAVPVRDGVVLVLIGGPL